MPQHLSPEPTLRQEEEMVKTNRGNDQWDQFHRGEWIGGFLLRGVNVTGNDVLLQRPAVKTQQLYYTPKYHSVAYSPYSLYYTKTRQGNILLHVITL